MGTLPAMRQEVQCGCCGGALPHALDRRRFMRLAGAGLALTLPASLVLAAEGDYEAMVLACIDPRMQIQPVPDCWCGYWRRRPSLQGLA